MRSYTILCVSHVAPWPATHGNEIRLQRLLLWMRKQNWRIVLVLTNHWIDPSQQDLIRPHVDLLILASPQHPLLQHRDRGDQIRRALHFIWPTGGRHPAPDNGAMRELADQLCPAYVTAIVQRLARKEKVDICFAFYAFTSQAFSCLPRRIPLICDAIEVFSMPRYNENGDPIKPVLAFSAEDEQAMLLQADAVIAIQSLEAIYLQRLLPQHTVITVGIDSDLPAVPGLPSQASEIIGIVGSDNPANLEGAEVFLHRCWPLIHASRPQAQLRIAGKLGKALEAQHPGGLPAGVSTLGWVASLDAFYRDLRLVVNPVLRGTGLKIKTVEALSYWRPVVATPVGIEGMNWDGDLPWSICADAQAMAGACIALLEDPSLCDAMAESARQFAIQTLAAETVYSPLAALLQQKSI